jgi:hypothetical protein
MTKAKDSKSVQLVNVKNILLISTEDNGCFGLAFGEIEKAPKIKIVKKPFKQSELLLTEIDKLVESKKLSGIIVVNGPGAFSGLRIGISTANALAYAWNIPITGIKLQPDWLVLSERQKVLNVWNKGIKKLLVSKFCILDDLVNPQYGAEPNIGKKHNS